MYSAFVVPFPPVTVSPFSNPLEEELLPPPLEELPEELELLTTLPEAEVPVLLPELLEADELLLELLEELLSAQKQRY